MTTLELTGLFMITMRLWLTLIMCGYWEPVTDVPINFHPPDEIESDVTGGLVVWDPSPDVFIDDPEADESMWEVLTAEDIEWILESPDPGEEAPTMVGESFTPPENNDPVIEEAKWYVTYKGRPFGNAYKTQEKAQEAMANAMDRVLLIDPYNLSWAASDFSTGEFDIKTTRRPAPWATVEPGYKGTGYHYSLSDPVNLKLLRDAIMMKYAEQHWQSDPDFGFALKEYLLATGPSGE